MVYRHIFLGDLLIAPGELNSLTGTVKPKEYLVQIVTAGMYKTPGEAKVDDLRYAFYVFDDEAYIIGVPAGMKKKMKEDTVPLNCPAADVIRQDDWQRYRIIRQRKILVEEMLYAGGCPLAFSKPTGKDWKKLFAAQGIYPIKKIGCSVIGFPYVEYKEEGMKTCLFR